MDDGLALPGPCTMDHGPGSLPSIVHRPWSREGPGLSSAVPVYAAGSRYVPAHWGHDGQARSASAPTTAEPVSIATYVHRRVPSASPRKAESRVYSAFCVLRSASEVSMRANRARSTREASSII